MSALATGPGSAWTPWTPCRRSAWTSSSSAASCRPGSTASTSSTRRVPTCWSRLAPAGTRALEIDGERTFGYTSVYLDTPDLLGYHLAAHRRRRRFKVRSRSYDGTGLAYLEVKTRDGARTVKTRLEGRHVRGDRAHRPGQRLRRRHAQDAGIAADVVASLRPVLRTRYRRTTLHLADDASRVTVDRGLDLDPHGDRATISQPSLVVVETKSAGAVSPMDRLLWSRGVPPHPDQQVRHRPRGPRPRPPPQPLVAHPAPPLLTRRTP